VPQQGCSTWDACQDRIRCPLSHVCPLRMSHGTCTAACASGDLPTTCPSNRPCLTLALPPVVLLGCVGSCPDFPPSSARAETFAQEPALPFLSLFISLVSHRSRSVLLHAYPVQTIRRARHLQPSRALNSLSCAFTVTANIQHHTTTHSIAVHTKTDFHIVCTSPALTLRALSSWLSHDGR